MKKRIVLLIFLSLLAQAPLFSAVNFAKNNSISESGVSPPIEAPSGKLTVGEKLLFDVYWMGLEVGMGSLEVKEAVGPNGRPAYHVVAIARTNDTLSKIYPIYDEIYSKIDAEEFYSYEFGKNLKEGRYRADERVVFDSKNRKGFYESFLNHTKKEFAILPKTQDFLSVFYWFRVQSIQAGQSVHTRISDKGKDYEVEIRVLQAQKKELRGGKVIWTIEVEPRTQYKEVLYRRGRGWVNFTMDGSRGPVLIRIRTPFGPVTGVLRA